MRKDVTDFDWLELPGLAWGCLCLLALVPFFVISFFYWAATGRKLDGRLSFFLYLCALAACLVAGAYFAARRVWG